MWTPTDYILFGQYCDSQTIREQLNIVRTKANARCAVLSVYQKPTFFQSLLFISHADCLIQNELQKRLFTTRVTQYGDLATLFEKFSETNGSFVKRLLEYAPFTELSADDIRSNAVLITPPLLPTRNRMPQLTTATIVVVLFNVRMPDVLSQLVDDMSVLRDMICASVPIQVRRDLQAAHDIDKKIDKFQPQDDVISVEKHKPYVTTSVQDLLPIFAESVLGSALSLTHSSVGNIYLAAADQYSLELASQLGTKNSSQYLDTRTSNSVISWVSTNQRPLLINDLDEFLSTRPDLQYVSPFRRDGFCCYAELAIPLRLRYLGSNRYSLLGVLNVEKVIDKDSGHYTYHDLATLRELSLRFCLWRSNAILAQAGRSLAHLTRPAEAQPSTDISHSMFMSEVTDLSVPYELLPTKAHVNDAVEQLYDLTRSISATVRLLSNDGQSLVRFASFPPEALEDPDRDIKVSAVDSAHAWVARNGMDCYIRSIDDRREYKKYSGLYGVRKVRDLSSELCVPIFVENRLLGCLNLESAFVDAYAETRWLARAVAEQVGLAFTQARRTVERPVFEVTANTLLNLHELLKCRDLLRAMSSGDNAVKVEELVDLSSRLDDAVMLPCQEAQPRTGDAKIILDAEIEALRIDKRIFWIEPPDKQHQLQEAQASALRIAAREVLHNARKEVLRTRGGTIHLHARTRVLGGIEYFVLEVVSNTLLKIPAVLTKRLYRIPINGPRVHIGAFIAGAIARSCGGDVYLRRTEKSLMATVIEIPIKR